MVGSPREYGIIFITGMSVCHLGQKTYTNTTTYMQHTCTLTYPIIYCHQPTRPTLGLNITMYIILIPLFMFDALWEYSPRYN